MDGVEEKQLSSWRYGIIGHPVKHSLSPLMHSASFAKLGINAQYEAFDVRPDELEAKLTEFRAAGFQGLNVTVPHKVAAMQLVDHLDTTATLYGALNTIRFGENRVEGFNTDAGGFLEDLATNCNATPESATIMVLGCGGAGRALAIACALHGARRLMLAEIAEERALQVAAEIRDKLPQAGVEVEVLASEPAVWTERCAEAEIVLQCTPSGLKLDDPPVLPATAFRSHQLVYDLIYNHQVTSTMASAAQGGATVYNGLGMLICQGALSFKIWSGREADVAAMRTAVRQSLYGTS